jgi:hypothetical protein
MLACNCNLPDFCLLCSLDGHCAQLLVWDGVLWTFVQGWPWTIILMISDSQVACYSCKPPMPGCIP